MLYLKTIKPQIDFWLALLLSLALLPLLVLLTLTGALAFGNPFFLQQRAGKKGRAFCLLKFKTMRGDASLPEAERINRYGAALRKFSLDELPQLFNVLAGHMSLVGPRPLPLAYLPLLSHQQKMRLTMKPGLTGLTQVSGRNQLSWEKKFELDNTYVRKVGLGFDILILVRTLPVWIKGQGVSHQGYATMPVFDGNKTEEVI